MKPSTKIFIFFKTVVYFVVLSGKTNQAKENKQSQFWHFAKVKQQTNNNICKVKQETNNNMSNLCLQKPDWMAARLKAKSIKQ